MSIIKIKNKIYMLSPRRAKDVLELAEIQDKLSKEKDDSNISQLFTVSRIINDSLRSTGLSLIFFKRWRYRKFIKGNGMSYILDYLTPLEIVEAYKQILMLEGGSIKKKVTMENQ